MPKIITKGKNSISINKKTNAKLDIIYPLFQPNTRKFSFQEPSNTLAIDSATYSKFESLIAAMHIRPEDKT